MKKTLKTIIATFIVAICSLSLYAQTGKAVVVHIPDLNKTIVANSISTDGTRTTLQGVVSEINGILPVAEINLALGLGVVVGGKGKGPAGLEVVAHNVGGCLGNASSAGHVTFFTCNPGCEVCYTYYTLANSTDGPPKN